MSQSKIAEIETFVMMDNPITTEDMGTIKGVTIIPAPATTLDTTLDILHAIFTPCFTL